MKQLLLALLISTSLLAQAQSDEILTNANVVELYKDGFGESLVIAKIKSSKNNFDVSLSGLKQLRSDSIPQTIIETMLGYAEKNKAQAQPDPNALPIPPFANTPMWLDTSTGELKAFERRVVNHKEKSGAAAVPVIGVIFSGGESYISISDVSSPVIFEASRLPRIFIKVSQNLDPSATVSLYNYSINYKKNQRELITSKSREGIATSNSGGSLTNIITDFKQITPGVYEITPTAPLLEGEYGFSNSSLSEMYAFRIWKSSDNNTTPPPTFGSIKDDLIGKHAGDWDFDATTVFEKVEQLNLQQGSNQITYTYALTLSKPQKGADLHKHITVNIEYKKEYNKWALYSINAE